MSAPRRVKIYQPDNFLFVERQILLSVIELHHGYAADGPHRAVEVARGKLDDTVHVHVFRPAIFGGAATDRNSRE
eukprot:CAMPEP_0113307048 /NCGR_PEP_ID=MMETSP0010_2-20120614/6059_1 /TAXON_ID=216773 ORGANISM="Corethron hystrix, Strain 308" /NCGR_SAMPLE_ID=MMETSP0010_2 /ASSEMBLY_ACC=CAM_ASM_000155 /LENGTH=74 /DNA_ID=CAMNT_0000161845 /DNA_START=626 /DNA_END=850 /DNA_ORIENTATION=+ /assembly_acc=CAM_ASM_000155